MGAEELKLKIIVRETPTDYGDRRYEPISHDAVVVIKGMDDWVFDEWDIKDIKALGIEVIVLPEDDKVTDLSFIRTKDEYRDTVYVPASDDAELLLKIYKKESLHDYDMEALFKICHDTLYVRTPEGERLFWDDIRPLMRRGYSG